MKLVSIHLEQIIGLYECEGFKEKVNFDLDRYNIEMKRPLSTHEYSITVDHKNKRLYGDVIRYGSWDDLTGDEIRELIKVVENEGGLVRPFKNYDIEE